MPDVSPAAAAATPGGERWLDQKLAEWGGAYELDENDLREAFAAGRAAQLANDITLADEHKAIWLEQVVSDDGTAPGG